MWSIRNPNSPGSPPQPSHCHGGRTPHLANMGKLTGAVSRGPRPVSLFLRVAVGLSKRLRNQRFQGFRSPASNGLPHPGGYDPIPQQDLLFNLLPPPNSKSIFGLVQLKLFLCLGFSVAHISKASGRCCLSVTHSLEQKLGALFCSIQAASAKRTEIELLVTSFRIRLHIEKPKHQLLLPQFLSPGP